MSVRVLVGDVLERLAELPDESVQCVVTSPPYWGLRDYGTSTWEGGEPECDHIAVPHSPHRPERSRATSETFHGSMSTNHSGITGTPYRDVCAKCGARRIDSQFGLEATPEEHVERMVEVFREVRRVLRGDGTLWLNYGDSYASNPASGGRGQQEGGEHQETPRRAYTRPLGLKPKDLVGMPWRIAFAFQADGWYLRSDIIWHKPNPMPESVTDRPTKSHEHVFLLAKSQKYRYDADAVREANQGIERPNFDGTQGLLPKGSYSGRDRCGNHPAGRNLRDVWTIATHAHPGAHFATFPPKLVEPCIKAGCPEDGTVLDPFGGAGTVGLVADQLGRNAVLIELNEEYAKMARRRIYEDCPLFTKVELEQP